MDRVGLMAILRKPPTYTPNDEVLDILIDTPRCIICNAQTGTFENSVMKIEKALQSILCDLCKAAVKSFRFLASRP